MPQLPGSLAVSTHSPPHSTKPAGHGTQSPLGRSHIGVGGSHSRLNEQPPTPPAAPAPPLPGAPELDAPDVPALLEFPAPSGGRRSIVPSGSPQATSAAAATAPRAQRIPTETRTVGGRTGLPTRVPAVACSRQS